MLESAPWLRENSCLRFELKVSADDLDTQIENNLMDVVIGLLEDTHMETDSGADSHRRQADKDSISRG